MPNISYIDIEQYVNISYRHHLEEYYWHELSYKKIDCQQKDCIMVNSTAAVKHRTRQTDKLGEMEKCGQVKCLTRHLLKKLTPTHSGSEVCRRSGRLKQVPRRYREDTAFGVPSGHDGTFGRQHRTDQSKMAFRNVKEGKHSGLRMDSEMAESNCGIDSKHKGRTAVQSGKMPLHCTYDKRQFSKRILTVNGDLFRVESNQVDEKRVNETRASAAECEQARNDTVSSSNGHMMLSERPPLGQHAKYMRRKCSICKETFSAPDILLAHRKSCHQRTRGRNPRKYACEQCPYVARTEKLQLIHMNNKHGVPLSAQDKYPVQVCQVAGCGYKSLYKQYVWRHHEAQHTGRKFVCEYCGKALRSKVALTLHVRIHLGMKPHVCHTCGLAFRQSSILKCHQRSIHETRSHHLLCHECAYTTNRKTSLDLHCYRRHGVALPSNISLFHCDICKFETVSKNSLLSHVRRHLGQRPFDCTVCHKTFVSLDDLRGHAVWHLPVSERQYKCPYETSEGCQYVAATNSRLSSHVRLQHTHKGDRPFTCHICAYKTGVKGNLTKHLRSVHHIEVTTHQVRVMPYCQENPSVNMATTDLSKTTLAQELSTGNTMTSEELPTGNTMTSDILTPVVLCSSSELIKLHTAHSTMFGSDAFLRHSADI